MIENVHNQSDLLQMQSLPLDIKIRMTQQRVRIWINEFGEDGVYVSYSGGKDSTVLLHLVRNIYPNVKAVFINTGLEYPAVRRMAVKQENTQTIRPKNSFKEVITKYGYPIISKDIAQKTKEVRGSLKKGNFDTVRYRQFLGQEKKRNGEPSEFNCEKWYFLLNAPFKISDECCNKIKKEPAKEYEKETGQKPIIGIMASESKKRKNKWFKYGCNAFKMKRQQSNPISFWTEQDILQYIERNNIEIPSVYGKIEVEKEKYRTTGQDRTGCIFCLFGITRDKDRIAKLQIQEPMLADYVLRGGEFGEDGYWKPSKNGLGYWFVIEWLNIHDLGIKHYKDINYAETYGNKLTRKILLKEKIKVKARKIGGDINVDHTN